jgi:hypothetical protein
MRQIGSPAMSEASNILGRRRCLKLATYLWIAEHTTPYAPSPITVSAVECDSASMSHVPLAVASTHQFGTLFLQRTLRDVVLQEVPSL